MWRIRLKSMKHITDYLIFTTECIYYSTHEFITFGTKSCILMNIVQMIITMYKKYMSIKVQNSFLMHSRYNRLYLYRYKGYKCIH